MPVLSPIAIVQDNPLAEVFTADMPSVDAVRRLEQMLAGLPQRRILPAHLVHGGMDARTVMIPSGTVLTGALINCDNICVVCGDIEVTTDAGPLRLTGYNVLPAKAGAKRVGVTITDTWWTMIVRTDLHDVAEIEREVSDEADQLQGNRHDIIFEDQLSGPPID